MQLGTVLFMWQEGAGHAVLSSYVEIVFDNSDGRFPVSHRQILACQSATAAGVW